MSFLMPKVQTPPPPPTPETPPPPPQMADSQGFVSQRNMLQRAMTTGSRENRTRPATAMKTLLGQ